MDLVSFTIVCISYRYSGLTVLTVYSRVGLMVTTGLNAIMYVNIFI